MNHITSHKILHIPVDNSAGTPVFEVLHPLLFSAVYLIKFSLSFPLAELFCESPPDDITGLRWVFT